jgi:glycosyltransferase involved in cell wall biosynthesis
VLGAVKKIYNEFNFDVIYVPWAYPDGFGSFLLSRLLSRPIVISALGSDINIHTKYILRRRLICFALKKCDGVIAVSFALRDKLIGIGVPQENILVIPNGVNRSIFKPINKDLCRSELGLIKEEKIILFVGNLVVIKGLDYLLEAFVDICCSLQNVKLIIIGDGKLKIYLQKKAKILGIGERVSFCGNKAHDTIPKWLNASDVFCLPSLNEGMPNVVLEALACGKSIVASHVGGVSEIVGNSERCILVPPANAKLLAAALVDRLRYDKQFSDEMHPTFMSWEENAEKVYRVLEQAVRRCQTSCKFQTEKNDSFKKRLGRNKSQKQIS